VLSEQLSAGCRFQRREVKEALSIAMDDEAHDAVTQAALAVEEDHGPLRTVHDKS
jgi:hypothetical protein